MQLETETAYDFAKRQWNKFAQENNKHLPTRMHYHSFDDLSLVKQARLEEAAAKHLAEEFSNT